MKGHTGFIICGLSILLVAAPGQAVQCQTASGNSWPLAVVLPGGHRGAVNALVYDAQGRILSAGADGFLGIWELSHNTALERFQVSSATIHAMVLRPLKTQIGLIESDTLGQYRISAWDYETKQKLFTRSFEDPISYITYSAGGNFLILGGTRRNGVIFVHPETGELLRSAPDIPGTVSFAATGRSERTMISYAPTGVLSYWDLESGKELRHFIVPPEIRSPILFGTNRFLGGIDQGGLVILDAVSGTEIVRDRSISQGTLVPIDPDLSEFVCASVGVSTLYHFSLSASGKLETKNRRTVSQRIAPITSAAITQDAMALGTTNGSLWIFHQDGKTDLMAVKHQSGIAELAASGTVLAIRSGASTGFIPLDYTQLTDNTLIRFTSTVYSHITAEVSESPEGSASATFLLWQENNPSLYPVIKQVHFNGRAFISTSDTILDKLSARVPLRSTAILGDQAIFLDAVGNITVLSTISGEEVFSFSAIGALDATFLDEGNILIGRSAISGNTPFLIVNILTGETVPLGYLSTRGIGIRVYRGSSGSVYGAVIDQESGTMKTVLLRINTTHPALSERLDEYPREDTSFGIAETGGFLGSTLGGEGANRYTPAGMAPFERSPGFPVDIIDGGRFFIILDGEGNIAWHDPLSGKLLALFHLYEDEWILETVNTGPVLRGRVSKS
jgi:WD40 repeat protein